MKQALALKMGQQLTMTPQLQQAIRLLQLSTVELQAEIIEALATNPLLETQEEAGYQQENNKKNQENTNNTTDFTENHAQEKAQYSDKSVSLENTLSANCESDSWHESPCWDELPQNSLSQQPLTDSQDGRDYLFNSYHEEETLHENLLWQLEILSLNSQEKIIALCLIDAINDDGYLYSPLESLHSSIAAKLPEITLQQVEDVLTQIIHTFEPSGVGARNIAECLRLQCRQLPNKTPFLKEANTIIESGLTILGKGQTTQLARRFNMSELTLNGAIKLIQSLNPYPGRQIDGQRTEYIIPDIIVKQSKSGWELTLNDENLPKLAINQQYAKLIKRAEKSKTNVYLKDNLNEARWLIKSLQSRHDTLLKVATFIVDYQQDFLLAGESAMKPLVLSEVAGALDMHESTISRATNRKYMLTPQGIFELKYFFSSHVGTASGGECSSTAIRALIKQLIKGENSRKPLSDSQLTKLLEAKGIRVARRTVAKYREGMNIPSSTDRKSVS